MKYKVGDAPILKSVAKLLEAGYNKTTRATTDLCKTIDKTTSRIVNLKMQESCGQPIRITRIVDNKERVVPYQYEDGNYYWHDDMFEDPKPKRNLPSWF